MLVSRLRPGYFFGAFAIGLLMCYLVTPTREVVVKFPSPFNAGSVVYTDKANGCFTFSADRVACPSENVKPQPVMEDFRARR